MGLVGPLPTKFNGTVASLVRAYRTDPDSPIHKIRHASRQNYIWFCNLIDKDHGAKKLADLGAREFDRWYADWCNNNTVSIAYAAMKIWRLVLRFGTRFEIEKTAGLSTTECLRLRMILVDTEFDNVAARTETLTRDHCLAVRSAAHAKGLASIAMAQAFQFELTLRQKDVVGEWVPLDEPMLSDVTYRGTKWIRGLRWEEIDANMILKHQMSKARKAKILEFDLKLYPMIMEEIGRISVQKRAGPIVVSEITGRPWKQPGFRQQWRDIATAAGVPKTVKNMDSRAGGTTETIDVTDGNLEAARKQAGHSNIATTQRYSRGALQSNSKVAVLRAGISPKNEA